MAHLTFSTYLCFPPLCSASFVSLLDLVIKYWSAAGLISCVRCSLLNIVHKHPEGRVTYTVINRVEALSGTLWSVLQMMGSSNNEHLQKLVIEHRPLWYSRNSQHSTVQKGSQLGALHCRAVVCVQASDAEQRIASAFTSVFFCLVLFSFSFRILYFQW